ncbi:LCP family protein [Streptomyces sp. NPDC016640]|uniref:LCP family protein n=1 Tax=Streptomyces sp. NPDC016640 TaxID=3364969 RepID=UPI0036F74421
MWTGGALSLVLVGGSAFAYYWYERLHGNISTVDIGDVGSDTVLTDGPVNLLIIGNDVRTGKGNEKYGDRDNVTGHADTTLLLHVSEDRTDATVLSIPRDLRTETPDCETRRSGGSSGVVPGSAGTTGFNESFGVDGRAPGCPMRTVESMTDLEIDHFMMFGFNAVKTPAWLRTGEGVLESTNRGNAPARAGRTRLEYAPDRADQARALAGLMGLPAPALAPGTRDAAAAGPMTLTLGPDFVRAGVPVIPPRKADAGRSRTDEKVCGK